MNGQGIGRVSRHHQRRVAIVEDHLLQRRRTEELVSAQPGLRVVFSGETLPDFVTWLATIEEPARPHLLVLDLQVDRGESADPQTVRAVVNAGIRVLALSAMASPALVRQILRAGIGGMVGKRDQESAVIGAIWTVIGGGTWMTPDLASVMAGDPDRPKLSDQEERALVLYASGLTLDSVAEVLGVQRDTAKKYLTRVKAKYAAAGQPVRTKVDLNAVAQRDGYLDPTSPPSSL